ncbi:winged helix-turn-helix domain-containing protein [Jinshanibacter sp. LJY008]|uniref:Winged helix-turn-helix domain-containing protein n=1 Tax=Limnobaculum eriocheiris TaxID=2897391 RepID=A0A9X1SKP7_9GAMM|nr:winged helix-turn-helix domain-containing protein [Limnobaculum eriocheiris]MCD1125900.1 winged helix-turn-helix domain-containing protein [Limnobaculum eriocheiris]
MNKIYVINEVVCFDPEKHTLSIYDQPGFEINLHIPASQCLHQLLLHNGQTLSQQFLFEQVWGKNGIYVSSNTLYQNIGLIRKAIKSIGLAEEVIKTLPKAGFKCIADVKEIQKSLPPLTPLPDHKTEVTLSSSQAEFIKKETTPIANELQEQHNSLKWVYLIAVTIFFFSSGWVYMTYYHNKNIFQEYYSAGNVNGCNLFSSYYDSQKSAVIFTALMKQKSINCPPGSTAYMNINRVFKQSSIIVCDKSIDSANVRCESHIYIETNDEQ